jgi:hypothetical protein
MPATLATTPSTMTVLPVPAIATSDAPVEETAVEDVVVVFAMVVLLHHRGPEPGYRPSRSAVVTTETTRGRFHHAGLGTFSEEPSGAEDRRVAAVRGDPPKLYPPPLPLNIPSVPETACPEGIFRGVRGVG